MSRERTNLCKKHPYYKAIRKPRVNCFSCYVAYYEKHGELEKLGEKMQKVAYRVAEMKYGKDKLKEMLHGSE